MNILGCTGYAGFHDTSAALVCDGRLVAAAEEERFTRRKHEGGIALRAIEFCLRHAGLDMAKVDVITYADLPFRTGCDSQHADTEYEFLRRLHAQGVVRYRSLIHKRLLDAYLRLGLPFRLNAGLQRWYAPVIESLRQRYPSLPPIRYYDHHRCHAAATFFTAGLERAAVATIDGRGGSYSSVVWRGEGRCLRRLDAEPFTNSLGFFYDCCAEYLGLGEFGEGKLMGLAAYGDPVQFADRVATILDTGNRRWYCYRTPPRPETMGFGPRRLESITSGPYPDFAAACQTALERAVARVTSAALDKAGAVDLCLGGGVSFNCSSNGALRESGIASSVWVFPAAGDAGLSVGAALLCAAELGELKPGRLEHAYWGPGFSAAECEAALRSEPRVRFRTAADLAAEVASHLAAGKVVGWFQGRMELGPRALGNRSILADPRSAEMRDRVNQIKKREMWRPLAPVVSAERTGEFFTNPAPSPFMLFATQVRPEKRALIPAVVHVDGSSRPQTVTREQNARLYGLLESFQSLTGVPVLLNTSFNTAGEPIVCTPQDAIGTFLASGLDLLVLGDYLVWRCDTHV